MEKEKSSETEALRWFLGSWTSLAPPRSFLCLFGHLLCAHDSILSETGFQLLIPAPKHSHLFSFPRLDCKALSQVRWQHQWFPH